MFGFIAIRVVYLLYWNTNLTQHIANPFRQNNTKAERIANEN